MRAIPLFAAGLALGIAAPATAQRSVEPGQPPHASPRVAAPTIVHAGRLMTAPGERVLTEATIVTEGGRIRSVEQGYRDAAALGLAAGTPAVDLRDKYVLPGFMDLHVHITSNGIAGRLPGTRMRQEDAFFALNGATNAKATLLAGFTTIRDLGAANDAIFSLRDAIRMGVVPGPKIVAAGRGISPTNGHGDAHDMKRAFLDAEPRDSVCDGPDDCRRATRAAIKYGADVIKVHVTGGVLDPSDAGTEQQFTDAELTAIAEAAHSMGRKVTTHAHGKGGIDAATRAGYDSIEHGMWADEESLRLMKQHGTWLIPTVWPITYVGDTPEKVMRGPMAGINPNSLAKLLKLGDQPKKLVRMAVKIGTPVALGTDSGISPHGTNAQEMVEYVDAGMTPVEALKTGTVNAAAAAGLADRGRIQPGLAADIIALDGDPVADINQVMNVDFVMRDGIVFKQAGKEVQ
ncbi:metal-dependent hydrolase family protein [Sphingomonas baiyangensis]|uniref:Amidohydrolase family protein n=1 Tax=Sphingomonas baiyangensis TaxID=2572576 RepID=A0A4U1L665_9SPHN|nr:amidohydrolase family protein [Sphingomonas baiyangensis]TKD51716.1 amidohydrolase family protein [Sphingomonas baiyangensis]